MKAKLQRQLAYRYKEKLQYKHVIVVPEEAVNKLGWKGGQELELCIKDSHLVVEAKNQPEQKEAVST